MSRLKLSCCPVCGANLSHNKSPEYVKCRICRFERFGRYITDGTTLVHKNIDQAIFNESFLRLQDISRLTNISYESYVYDDLDTQFTAHNIMPKAYHKTLEEQDLIWSELMLPYMADLDDFFRERFLSLKPGGLLFLSTPITVPFRITPRLDNQVNFFKARHVMIMLERHGFKVVWRTPFWQTELRVYARRM